MTKRQKKSAKTGTPGAQRRDSRAITGTSILSRKDRLVTVARVAWQVTVKDESGKETHIRATNYADANGPYHWPEGLPWTPIS